MKEHQKDSGEGCAQKTLTLLLQYEDVLLQESLAPSKFLKLFQGL
jgi:hypothetical protein